MMEVKWTMITAWFGLMVMLRIANTGSILYYTGLSCINEDEEMFAKITQYYCNTHNPYKILRSKYVLKNVIIMHMWSDICQTPNNITKASIVSASNYCAFFEKTFLNLFFLMAVRCTAV